MSENVRDTEKLSPSQQRAIAAMLTARTIGEVAAAAGVSERTINRWQQDPLFRTELTQAEGAAIDGAVRKLIVLQTHAIATVASVMADETQLASVRLRAAQTVLENVLRLRELRNVEARLAALENKLITRGED